MNPGAPTVGVMALYTVHGEGGQPPSLAAAAAELGVSLEDLDAAFGVVTVDPPAGLYAVQARSDRVEATTAAERRHQGPYSSPPIVPLDPARKPVEDD
jgi:hypothetical protein